MENFIQAKLMIITWEQFSESSKHSYISVWDRGLYIKWCVIDSLHNPDLKKVQSKEWVMGHQALYRIKKENYLLKSCDPRWN